MSSINLIPPIFSDISWVNFHKTHIETLNERDMRKNNSRKAHKKTDEGEKGIKNSIYLNILNFTRLVNRKRSVRKFLCELICTFEPFCYSRTSKWLFFEKACWKLPKKVCEIPEHAKECHLIKSVAILSFIAVSRHEF